VKGQGHTVMKTVEVPLLLVTRAAMAVCWCCRRGSACRYDCLCSLFYIDLSDTRSTTTTYVTKLTIRCGTTQ